MSIKATDLKPAGARSWVRHAVDFKFGPNTTSAQLKLLATKTIDSAIRKLAKAGKPLKIVYGPAIAVAGVPASLSSSYVLVADFADAGAYEAYAEDPALDKAKVMLGMLLTGGSRLAVQYAVNWP